MSNVWCKMVMARKKVMVSGKEDKMPLAGSRRKARVPGQESGLGGELGQTYPLVSRGYKQVRVTSGRS